MGQIICDALQQKVPYGPCYKLLVWYKYYSVISVQQSFQVKRFNMIGCKLWPNPRYVQIKGQWLKAQYCSEWTTDIETEIPKLQYRPRKFFSRLGEQFGGIRDFAEKRCGECAMHITCAITLMCVAEVAAFLARLKTRSYRRKMQLTHALSE